MRVARTRSVCVRVSTHVYCTSSRLVAAVVPVPLEVEDVADLVTRAQQQVDVRLGV
jgi:hypothetical protein